MTARVGLIIPSSNRMVEDEMNHAFPPTVRKLAQALGVEPTELFGSTSSWRAGESEGL